jgi:hypothetical protein
VRPRFECDVGLVNPLSGATALAVRIAHNHKSGPDLGTDGDDFHLRNRFGVHGMGWPIAVRVGLGIPLIVVGNVVVWRYYCANRARRW